MDVCWGRRDRFWIFPHQCSQCLPIRGGSGGGAEAGPLQSSAQALSWDHRGGMFCWTLPSMPLGCPVQTQSPVVGQAVAQAAGSLVCVGLCAMGAPDSGSRLAARSAGPCGVPALGSLGPNLGQGMFLPTLPGGCGQPQSGLVLALCPKPSCWPPPPRRALALGALSWSFAQWRRAVFFSLLTT